MSSTLSPKFIRGIIDNCITIASDFSMLKTLESLDLSPTRLRTEIQKTLKVYSESLEQTTIYLKICERDNYLSSDDIWNYQMKIVQIRDKITEATRRHSKDFSLEFAHLRSLYNIIYTNINNNIPIVKEREKNYLITPETMKTCVREYVEVCHTSCKIIEAHLENLSKEGMDVKEYRRELILIRATLVSITQIEGLKQ